MAEAEGGQVVAAPSMALADMDKARFTLLPPYLAKEAQVFSARAHLRPAGHRPAMPQPDRAAVDLEARSVRAPAVEQEVVPVSAARLL